jgi:hypothetical protein
MSDSISSDASRFLMLEVSAVFFSFQINFVREFQNTRIKRLSDLFRRDDFLSSTVGLGILLQL